MSADLRAVAAEYLAVRRALGFGLVRAGLLLDQFLDHLDATGQTVITIQAALGWATAPDCPAASHWPTQRLAVVRGLAVWAHSADPRHELIPAGLLPGKGHRATPYLYSAADVAALIGATATLKTPLRRATYATLVGLLSVTGMRLGEVINLDLGDIDPVAGTLLIRNAKFGKTRQVMAHPSTIAALAHYQQLRDQGDPPAKTEALLVSTAGTRLLPSAVGWTFRRLVAVAGLEPRGPARPRIHDLRH